MMKLFSPKFSAILFSVTVGFAFPCFAQTTTWTDATGDWFTSGNWDNGVPNLTTNAQINKGTAQILSAGAIADYVTLGANSSDSGTLYVGNGATLTTNNRSLDVGANGIGTVTITGGATVTNNFGADSIIGDGSTGVGTVTVDGSGASWTNTGNLSVGRGGNGTLHITSGGLVSNTGLAGGDIASFAGSTGLVTVDGGGSLWSISGSLDVGDRGNGTLTITNGGKVTNTSMAIVGDNVTTLGVPQPVTATGVVNVGLSSTWTNTGDTVIGLFGNGAMHITQGGTVSNATGYIAGASFAGGSPGVGAVTVDGTGSTWTNSSDLNVGFRGAGTLMITNKGAVGNDNGVLGHDAGTNGMVTVDGAGSSWTNTGTLSIGFDGNGSLNITDGASVAVSGSYVRIAEEQSSVSSVTVDGVGSSLTIAHELDVARAGTGTLTIRNGGSVTMTGSDRAAIGVDSGSNGTVIVDGAGSTWNVPTNIYVGGDSGGAGGTGLLRVTNGAVVNAANVFVQSTGTLQGNATINANVLSSGLVSPGTSPGTLTINGDYTQFSAGVLKIEIGGLNAGVNSDLLQINGIGGSTLDGTLQLIRINNFKPAVFDRVNIINTDPHTGEFSTVDLVNWGLIRPVPMYDEANDVYVVFQLTGNFASEALTRSQRSVANELDNVSSDPRAANLIAFLGSEPLGNLPHDYDLIAPEELASIYEIGFSQAVVQNMNLMHRMDDIRSGSTGYSGPVVETPTGKDEAPIADKNMVSKNEVPAFVPCPENRWGVFALGSGDFVDVGNDDNNARGYSLTTGSMLVGVDYRFGDHIAIGVDGEYANDIAELADKGRVYVDGGKAGAFATVYGNGWFGSKIYVDLAGNGGWNSYDTRRVGLQGEDVRGSTDGAEWNGMLAYGADWSCGHLTFGTWSSLQYTDVQFNHFSERGSLAPLEFPDQDEDSIRTTSGIRASYEMKFGNCGFVRPEVRAGWQHEYGDEAYPIDSRLASGAGDIFRVWGPTVGRDAALVDAGVTVQLNARFSTYVFYDGVLGRSNYQSNAVSGGIGLSF